MGQGSDAPCWGSLSIFRLTFTCIIKHKVLSTQGFQNSQGRVWSQSLGTSRWSLTHPFLPVCLAMPGSQTTQLWLTQAGTLY